MKILILGKNGQLAWALERRAAPLGEVVSLGIDDFDFADLPAVAACVEDLRPDVVFNAAAYTAVDRAEQERELAFKVNAEAPGVLAKACAARGAVLVHYSTDYVFDGRKDGRYLESDPTGPLNVYGASKLAGERATLEAGGAALVFRTSWVYGDHGGNFAKTMLRLACERDALRVVGDQRGTPTWAGRLADLSCAVVEQGLRAGDAAGWIGARRGLYHAAAAGETNWADYARCVIATAAEDPAWAATLRVRADAIEAIPASAYPTPAARPANSLLDCGALGRTFGYAMPDWRTDVVAFVRRLTAAGTSTA
ncbi:MAG TPA: dTDP-4-dehydrorhamnose reductase [Burkholderiaceae bacterium]|nr:dTDP-4-dehydrorhamnose reductase [Burkholderiaceae bacterium]